MLKVGITGGIGSGKSTVCTIFEVLGIPVYDADQRAKELINNDKVIRKKIIQLLGEAAYNDQGYNREYVAANVFNNPEKLQMLNAIVHPAVGLDAAKWFAKQHAPYALQEAALLVENGSYKLLDYLISVTAPEEIRVQRVMSRDGVSREQVQQRMKNQLPQAEKDKVADFIIDNSGSTSLINQVINVHLQLIMKDEEN